MLVFSVVSGRKQQMLARMVRRGVCFVEPGCRPKELGVVTSQGSKGELLAKAVSVSNRVGSGLYISPIRQLFFSVSIY